MIQFILNGSRVSYDGCAADRLLDVLRDQFDCRSIKCGCKEGECGACAVLIDGQLRNSCCVAVGAVEGATILSMEGYRETARFAALSSAFSEESAVQCGFCMPGMALAAEALLSRNAHPGENEIREALSGNLCRCTGYNAIVRAVQRAAKEGQGLW